MVGETAVEGIEQVMGLLAVNLLCEEVGHSVREVKGDVQVTVVALVLEHEVDIILMDILLVDGSALGCDRSLAALFDPLLDLA